MPRLTCSNALPRAVPAAVPGLALFLVLAATAPAFAAASPADGESLAGIRPVVGVLLTGTVSDNKSNVTNPDGSGAYGSLSGRYEAFAGAEFPVDPNGLAIRLTAGVHASAGFTGGGGGEHATSIPLEATLWYPLSDQLRVGGGVRYPMHTRFSGAGHKTSDGLNPTPSLVFGVGVKLLPHVLLDLRYVYERYEQTSGDELDASHWGVGLTAIY